jgi:hypothetical protein
MMPLDDALDRSRAQLSTQPFAAAPTETWGVRFNAYGAMFVTATIFLLMLIGLSIAAWWRDTQLFNGLMETVKALVMVAAGFWIGSSNSSQKKDDTLAATAAALATSTPAPVVTTTTTEAPAATTTTTTGPASSPELLPRPCP